MGLHKCKDLYKIGKVRVKYNLLKMKIIFTKAILVRALQAWTGFEGSRRLGLPDLKKSAHEGGKVGSRTQRPPLPQGNIPGTHFC
jgi:hypothetical protein